MNLTHYFITEQNYNPVVVHGINDEIWLENLNSDYKNEPNQTITETNNKTKEKSR